MDNQLLQYWDKACYENFTLVPNKPFKFQDGFILENCLIKNGTDDATFKMAVDEYDFYPSKFSKSSKLLAPYVVKIKLPICASDSPFSLANQTVEKLLGRSVDYSYNGFAYLNTDEKVYKQLVALTEGGNKPSFVAQVKVRFVVLHEDQNPRMKYLLQSIQAVQKPGKKRKQLNKQVSGKKIHALMDENAQSTPSSFNNLASDVGNVDAFFASVGDE